jgi:hypothetical protein
MDRPRSVRTSPPHDLEGGFRHIVGEWLTKTKAFVASGGDIKARLHGLIGCLDRLRRAVLRKTGVLSLPVML